MSGRIRTLKPELLEDERTAGLSHEAFRLFVGLVLLADDHGSLAAHPKRIDAAVFWARESRESVASLLDELARASLVVLYTVRGQQYVHLRGWTKHQKVDHPSKPRVPTPAEADPAEPHGNQGTVGDPREGVANVSRESRESLAPDPDLRSRPPTSDPDQYPDRKLLRSSAASGARHPSPPKDREPPKGSPAEAVRDAIVADPILAPIVASPGDFAIRATDPAAFPALDVLAEVKRAAAWLAANPAAKKKQGAKFLTGWLTRGQERARVPGGAEAMAPSQRPGLPSRITGPLRQATPEDIAREQRDTLDPVTGKPWRPALHVGVLTP